MTYEGSEGCHLSPRKEETMKFLDNRLVEDDRSPTRKTTYLEAFVPPEVKHGRIPQWLKVRLKAAVKAGKLQRVDAKWGNSYLLNSAIGATEHWFDHWGTVTNDRGQELFVSEPYGLTGGDVEKITKFCKLLDLNFGIDAASYHYPTRCLRVEIYP